MFISIDTLQSLINKHPDLACVRQRSEQTQFAVISLSERISSSNLGTVLNQVALFLHLSQCRCLTEEGEAAQSMWSFARPVSEIGRDRQLRVNFVCSHRKCRQTILCGVPAMLSWDGLSSQSKWECRLLAALGGLEFSAYAFGSLEPEPESSWYRSMETIWKAVEAANILDLQRIRLELLSQGKQRKVCFDGAWATRGFSANQFAFVVMDIETEFVVEIICLEKEKKAKRGERVVTIAVGNYAGTSNSMEAEALDLWIQQNKDNFLDCVRIIFSDGDLKAPKLLLPLIQTGQKIHALDRGHYVKGKGKAIKKVLKGKFDNIYKRMQVFLALILKRVHKEVTIDDYDVAHAARLELFKSYWKFAYPHYFNDLCDVGCPCNKDARQGDAQNPPAPSDRFDDPSRTLTEAWEADSDDDDASDSDASSNSSQEDEEGDVHQNVDLTRTVELPSVGNRPASPAAITTITVTIPIASPVVPPPVQKKEKKRPYVSLQHKCSKSCSSPCKRVTTHQKMRADVKAIFEGVNEDVSAVLWGGSTTIAENVNSVRAKHVKKTKAYGSTYIARTSMSTLIFNRGYLKAAELVWEEALKDPQIASNVGPLSIVLKQRLRAFDVQREKDSVRKKSDTFKEQEQQASRKRAEKRKAESKAPVKGKYGANAINRVKSSAGTTCKGCGAMLPDLRGHWRSCPNRNSTASTVRHRLSSSSPTMDIDDQPSDDDPDDDASISDDDEDDETDLPAIEQVLPDLTSLAIGAPLLPFENSKPMSYQEELDMVLKLSMQEANDRTEEIAREHRVLCRYLSNSGLIPFDVPQSRDGNCYFHVLAYFLLKAPARKRIVDFRDPANISPALLRAHVVNWLRAHPTMIFVRETEHITHSAPACDWFAEGEFETYLNRMAQNGVFADDVIVAAASHSLNLEQKLYCHDWQEAIKNTEGSARECVKVNVALNVVERHYYAVIYQS